MYSVRQENYEEFIEATEKILEMCAFKAKLSAAEAP